MSQRHSCKHQVEPVRNAFQMKSPQQSYRVPELCWTLIPIYLSAEITISLMNFWAALIRLFLFSSTFWPFSSLKWENRNTHNLRSVIRNTSPHWFSVAWSYFKRELCFRNHISVIYTFKRKTETKWLVLKRKRSK